MKHAPWSTIPELIDDAAVRFADTEAVSDGEVSLTFAELVERIRTVGRALMASGVAPGDRVAIWAPNIVEWVVVALGTYVAGAQMVPINTRFKGSEAAFVIERSDARILFTVSDFLGLDYVRMLEDEPGAQRLRETVILRGEAPPATTPLADLLARADQVTERDRVARAAALTPDDVCHILFTSGTTGKPKGVMLRHGGICDGYLSLAEIFEMEHGDRQLVVLPFFHSFGLHVGILCAFMKGATILPQLVFDADAVMKRISDDRVSIFPGPPSVFQAIVNSPNRDDYDLSTLKSVTLGGAGFSPDLVEGLQNLVGVPRVQSGYGLTETSGLVALCSPLSAPEAIANTTGVPLPGVEVKIVDDGGNDAPTGEDGEILVRGYVVMKGYLDDPQATDDAIDDDGWFHTGDIGHYRADGNLKITDRKKDMYTIGGFNAYPAEIEAVLTEHRAIGQIAVIGVPDDLMGEVGMAFVVPAPGERPEPDEIIAWARERMANYKVPRHVEIVDALPLNATGKVVKPELRELAAGRGT